MKIVINRCEGGFGLSKKARRECKKLGLVPNKEWRNSPALRDDPRLVAVVERLGPEADGDCAWLFVVEIPDDVEWDIEELNGMEWIIDRRWKWRRGDWSEGRRNNQIFASDFITPGEESTKVKTMD